MLLKKRSALLSTLAAGAAINTGTGLAARTRAGQKMLGANMIGPIAEGYRGSTRGGEASSIMRGMAKSQSRDLDDGLEVMRGLGEKMKTMGLDPKNANPRILASINRMAKGDFAGGMAGLNRHGGEYLPLIKDMLKEKSRTNHMAKSLHSAIGGIEPSRREAVNTIFKKTAIPGTLEGFVSGARKTNNQIWDAPTPKGAIPLLPQKASDLINRTFRDEVPFRKARKLEERGYELGSGIGMASGNVVAAGRNIVGKVAERTKDSVNPIGKRVHRIASEVGETGNMADSVIGGMAETAYARGLSGVRDPAKKARIAAYTPLQGASGFVQEQAQLAGDMQRAMTGRDSVPYRKLLDESAMSAIKRVKKDGGYRADL